VDHILLFVVFQHVELKVQPYRVDKSLVVVDSLDQDETYLAESFQPVVRLASILAVPSAGCGENRFAQEDAFF